MDIKNLISSGNALNTLIDTWKENAIEYILKLLKNRKYNQFNFKNYNFSISPKVKNVYICGCDEVGILSIDLIREVEDGDYFVVEDGSETYHRSWELTHNDLLKILAMIKAVQKADEAAKDF